jgi:hypothetical protein
MVPSSKPEDRKVSGLRHFCWSSLSAAFTENASVSVSVQAEPAV